MAFIVTSGYNRYGSIGGSGGIGGIGDLLLNFSVNANGDTGHILPANALIKAIILKGTSIATIRFGSLADPQLLVPDTTIAANVRESYLPGISLPAVLPIFADGILGVVSITFVYQIVTV